VDAVPLASPVFPAIKLSLPTDLFFVPNDTDELPDAIDA